jgi:DNA mismatch endonuclease (patch repair protein)
MQAIRGKDTKPELQVRLFLFSNGFRGYRLHVKALPGRPDIVFRKRKTIIEVYGCFFHRHRNCKNCTTTSKSSKTDWNSKFEANVERDLRNKRLLTQMGWKVIIIWECQLEGKKKNDTLDKLRRKLEKAIPNTKYPGN